MFERFAGEARRVALKAHSVAAGLGSSSVEAEHLLVSLAGTQHPAGAALREAGLEPEELHAAIQRDFERVLARVGIDAGGVDVSANCRRTKLRWGASAKRGLERALEEAKRRGDRKIGPEHILLGLLRAEHGTVPRLLAAEGIDRDELTGRL
jgi:D-alanyl-D-alanine carboxypeptidase